MRLFQLNELKKTWASIAQVSIWLSGLLATFVAEPPRLWVTSADDHNWLHFSQFILAILIGVLFVAFGKLSIARRVSSWLTLASVAVVIGALLFAIYFYSFQNWTCEYDARGRMVVGATLSSDAVQYLATNHLINCERLIQDYAGQTDAIWDRQEILQRYMVLSAYFSAAVVLLSISAMAMIEAVRSNSEGSAAKPRRKK